MSDKGLHIQWATTWEIVESSTEQISSCNLELFSSSSSLFVENADI